MSIEEWYKKWKHEEEIEWLFVEDNIFKSQGKMCSNCGFKVDGICMSFGDCYRGNFDGTKDYWREAEWAN